MHPIPILLPPPARLCHAGQQLQHPVGQGRPAAGGAGAKNFKCLSFIHIWLLINQAEFSRDCSARDSARLDREFGSFLRKAVGRKLKECPSERKEKCHFPTLPYPKRFHFYLRRSRQVKAGKVFFFLLLLLLLWWPLSFNFPNVLSKGVWKEKSL